MEGTTNLKGKTNTNRNGNYVYMIVSPHDCGGGLGDGKTPILLILNSAQGGPYLVDLDKNFFLVKDKFFGGSLANVDEVYDTKYSVHFKVDCTLFIQICIIILHLLLLRFFMDSDKLYPLIEMIKPYYTKILML